MAEDFDLGLIGIPEDELDALLGLAEKGVAELLAAQQAALSA